MSTPEEAAYEPVRARDTAPLDAALQLARRSAFHRDRLGGARAEDWAGTVPFMDKDDLRRAYPFGLLAVDRSEVETFHESTGTSGRPTASYFTAADWDEVADRCGRSAADLGPSDTVLVKTPYALVTTAHQLHRTAVRHGAMVVPADNRSSNMSYPRVLRLLRDLEVTVTWSLPTEPLLWAAAARALGMDTATDFPSLRVLMVAGEPVSAAKRRRMGELFGAGVVEDFGSTETGSMGGECSAGRLHLWADQLYFEVIDDAGAVSDEGSGELVVTTLTRRAMPLIRYRLGDRAAISYAPCTCGSPLPTARISGRVGSGQHVGGRSLSAVDLEECVFSLPAAHGILFYRARVGGPGLEIEIEQGHGTTFDLAREAADELRRLVAHHLGVEAGVVPRRTGCLVDPAALLSDVDFRKPRFLFGPGEDWSSAITY